MKAISVIPWKQCALHRVNNVRCTVENTCAVPWQQLESYRENNVRRTVESTCVIPLKHESYREHNVRRTMEITCVVPPKQRTSYSGNNVRRTMCTNEREPVVGIADGNQVRAETESLKGETNFGHSSSTAGTPRSSITLQHHSAAPDSQTHAHSIGRAF